MVAVLMAVTAVVVTVNVAVLAPGLMKTGPCATATALLLESVT
jgi:hypothetical protein